MAIDTLVRDLRSLGKHWNHVAMQRIAASLPENARPRPWPLFGMLLIGLVAGAAIGALAVSQRSQISRLALRARRVRDEMTSMGKVDVEPVTVTTHRANHRRKETSEV
jgi:hypothetical protein